jgi:hypothetical protein
MGFSFNRRHGGKGRKMEGNGEQVHPEAVVLSAEYQVASGTRSWLQSRDNLASYIAKTQPLDRDPAVSHTTWWAGKGREKERCNVIDFITGGLRFLLR